MVIGTRATASPDFLLIDLPGTSGRLDVLLRCVRAALLVSHGLRRDTVVYLVLLGGPAAPRSLRIDGATFRAGTPVNFRYSFPYYRAGWAYNVLSGVGRELAFGVSLQIRNATIDFATADGTLQRSRSDIGPVPLVRARGRFAFAGSGFVAFDVDGFYAPISVLNGSDNEVVGAILDASVRVGWRPRAHVDLFVSARYIGGGATGQGDPTPTSDGYQSNWLHFFALSVGATLDSRPVR